MVNLEIWFSSSQVIHALVKNDDGVEWLLSVVYASPILEVRRNLWRCLEEFATEVSLPWIMIGDFHDICSADEKFGGANVEIGRCFRFNSMISNCGLSDLGCQGPAFTWCNPRKGGARIQERLDRAGVW